MSTRKHQSVLCAQTDADVRNVLDAIRKIVRVLRLASREAEKRVGLSAAQLFVLQKLAEASTLSINDVAARTHTHQSSVSVVVHRLVERKLVARKRSTQDARQVLLSVTAAGRTVLRDAPQAAQGRLIAALAETPASRRHLLAVSLKDLVDRLGVDPAEPVTMLFESEENHARK